MGTDLNVGDQVYVHSGVEPGLSFVITEFQKLETDRLACGAYGCIQVDLLRKATPEAVTKSRTDRRSSQKVCLSSK
ncbi:hypothetical protein BH09BAC4_BH09BAC4_50590 [soil metagenome]